MTCVMFSLFLSHVAMDSLPQLQAFTQVPPPQGHFLALGPCHSFALTYFCLLPLLFLDSFHKMYSDSDSPAAAVFICLPCRGVVCFPEASIFVVYVFPHLYLGRLAFDNREMKQILLRHWDLKRICLQDDVLTSGTTVSWKSSRKNKETKLWLSVFFSDSLSPVNIGDKWGPSGFRLQVFNLLKLLLLSKARRNM